MANDTKEYCVKMKQHNQQKHLKLWFVIVNASLTTVETQKYHLPSIFYCASKQEKKNWKYEVFKNRRNNDTKHVGLSKNFQLLWILFFVF